MLPWAEVAHSPAICFSCFSNLQNLRTLISYVSTTLDDVNYLFTNEEACISFLREHSVFYTFRNCEICQDPMTYYKNSRRFHCNKTTCRSEASFKTNSFFNSHKLSCSKILRHGYFWLSQCPTKGIVSMTGHSKNTVAYFSH